MHSQSSKGLPPLLPLTYSPFKGPNPPLHCPRPGWTRVSGQPPCSCVTCLPASPLAQEGPGYLGQVVDEAVPAAAVLAELAQGHDAGRALGEATGVISLNGSRDQGVKVLLGRRSWGRKRPSQGEKRLLLSPPPRLLLWVHTAASEQMHAHWTGVGHQTPATTGAVSTGTSLGAGRGRRDSSPLCSRKRVVLRVLLKTPRSPRARAHP